MILVLIILGILAFSFLLLSWLSRYSSSSFWCKKMRWHHDNWIEDEKSFDGISSHSVCKRCNEEVMQDSQGNWF